MSLGHWRIVCLLRRCGRLLLARYRCFLASFAAAGMIASRLRPYDAMASCQWSRTVAMMATVADQNTSPTFVALQWAEGPSSRREAAAKQAELARAELETLSQRMAAQQAQQAQQQQGHSVPSPAADSGAGGGAAAAGTPTTTTTSGGGGGGGGGLWSRLSPWALLEQAVAFLLNRLQITVNNVHVCFAMENGAGQVRRELCDSWMMTNKCRALCSLLLPNDCTVPRPWPCGESAC